MSKRSKKSKSSAFTGLTGNHKNSQHITKISATPSRESKSPKPASTRPQDAEPAGAVIPETVITDDGKTAIRPADNTELNQPDPKAAPSGTQKKLTRAERKQLKASRKALKKAGKTVEDRDIKTYFVLARPFVRFGRYLRDSWREIRQVRWPNRKATWKMTLAVLVYVALFMVILVLLDAFFTFIFDLIFKK